ncbi:hypothetical protein D3C78_1892440 [compost metagenome]
MADLCFKAMAVSELGFSGIDLKRVGPDRYVIIELNYSPVFVGIEALTGHPISAGLAEYLIQCAQPGSARRGFFHFEAPRPGQ